MTSDTGLPLDWIEYEQRRLAQLLHGTSAQTLTAARLCVRMLRGALQRDFPDALPRLLVVEELIEAGAGEIQDLTTWLNPVRLDGSALVPALTELCELASRSVPCSFHCNAQQIDASPQQQTELLRITRLALHALLPGKQKVGLTLSLDDRELVVELSAAQRLPRELEAALNEHARAARGTFTTREELHGVTLACRLPRDDSA